MTSFPQLKSPNCSPTVKKGYKGDSWNAYLSAEHKKSPQTEAVLFIPLDHSCEPCKLEALVFYKKFRKDHPELPFTLVAAAAKSGGQTEIDKYLKDTLINPADPRTLYDPKGKYLKYVVDFVNPRLICVQKGKITSDVILNPAQIPELPEKVEKFFNLSGESKKD